MDSKTCKVSVDFQSIYTDIINKKFPHRKKDILPIFNSKRMISLDVIELNKKIFGKENDMNNNNRYRSYGKADIEYILNYQKKYELNNLQLAAHFNISRNTIAKWQKIALLKK